MFDVAFVFDLRALASDVYATTHRKAASAESTHLCHAMQMLHRLPGAGAREPLPTSHFVAGSNSDHHY
jgi:hypothetical protein